MTTQKNSSAFQKKVEDLINGVIIPESKIIFGKQFPGVKPNVSASMIIEGILKIYIQKVDPQQKTSRWGLGKLFGHSCGKTSFPDRFKKHIENINNIRIGVLHKEGKGGEITIEELRKFLSNFIKWFYNKIIEQPVSLELSKIIDYSLPDIKISPKNNIKHKIDEIIIFNRETKNESSERKVPIKPDGIKTIPYSVEEKKLYFQIFNNNKFTRTYYHTKELLAKDFRGSISKINLIEYSDLSIIFELKDGKIFFTNKSKKIPISIDSKKMSLKTKTELTIGNYSLTIGNFLYTITIKNY